MCSVDALTQVNTAARCCASGGFDGTQATLGGGAASHRELPLDCHRPASVGRSAMRIAALGGGRAASRSELPLDCHRPASVGRSALRSAALGGGTVEKYRAFAEFGP